MKVKSESEVALSCPTLSDSTVYYNYYVDVYPKYLQVFVQLIYTIENGKSCLFSLMYAAAVTANSLQSCLTLCNTIDGSPPGSTVPGILQARTLE